MRAENGDANETARRLSLMVVIEGGERRESKSNERKTSQERATEYLAASKTAAQTYTPLEPANPALSRQWW
jgi:hypothetical protein